MSLTRLIVPTYTQMLSALSGWLDKAQAQRPGADAQTLLSARLAPDMFPLSTQIRFACVQAQEAIFRLRGEDFPPSITVLLEEGRNAADMPGKLAEAQQRIAETVALLENAGSAVPEAESQSDIAHELPNGMIFDLTAEQYARDWTIPQFYFHLMTAYAILRSEKIDLGKADYIPHMFPYLRPETAPSA
jgi:hypothetical protein